MLLAFRAFAVLLMIYLHLDSAATVAKKNTYESADCKIGTNDVGQATSATEKRRTIRICRRCHSVSAILSATTTYATLCMWCFFLAFLYLYGAHNREIQGNVFRSSLAHAFTYFIHPWRTRSPLQSYKRAWCINYWQCHIFEHS